MENTTISWMTTINNKKKAGNLIRQMPAFLENDSNECRIRIDF